MGVKLLIVTQKVDRTDPILGFFHRWLQEFSKHAELTVIGQYVGAYDLPNVHVLSLEKEKSLPRPMQILRFWKFLWSERKNYDAILVHMTPIWLVLGAPLLILLGKRRYLWYEARGKTLSLRLSMHLAQKVFSASRHGMPLPSSKSMITGHGIDTAMFAPANAPRDPHLLVTVGRVTPSKRLELMIDALSELSADMNLQIIGIGITDRDRAYRLNLDEQMQERNLLEQVKITPLSQNEIITLLQKATTFVHASTTPLDKALLEAMSCGCPVVSCAEAAVDILPKACLSKPATFAADIRAMLQRSEGERTAIGGELRSIIQRDHDLSCLIERLVTAMA